MRTNIDIDDQLLAQAMAAGACKTKKEAVEQGLRLLARRSVYQGLLALRGQLAWDDSDAAWAARAAAQPATPGVQEPPATYLAAQPAATTGRRKPKTP